MSFFNFISDAPELIVSVEPDNIAPISPVPLKVNVPPNDIFDVLGVP